MLFERGSYSAQAQSGDHMSRSEASSVDPAPAVVQAESPVAKANRRVANLLFGARKLIFDELQFTSNEMLERTQTEMHLFSEFLSKMAGAHSVNDIRSMYAECSKHQIDFLRRDCDRLFKHGERMIEAGSNLFKNDPPD
jgi:hypothetical protein